MTREEALNVIWLRCQHNDETYEAYCVLKHEQQPCDDATLKDIFCMGCEYKEQNPCEPVRNSDQLDCVNRQAVLNTLENMDRALDEDRTVENYKELLRECYKVLPSVSSSEKLIVKKSRGLVKDLVKASPTETESEA